MGKRLVLAALLGSVAVVVLAAGCSTSSAPASAALECKYEGRTYGDGKKRIAHTGFCQYDMCECTGDPSASLTGVWSCKPYHQSPHAFPCGQCAYSLGVGFSYPSPGSPCNRCTCTTNEADLERPTFVCTNYSCLDAGPDGASDVPDGGEAADGDAAGG